MLFIGPAAHAHPLRADNMASASKNFSPGSPDFASSLAGDAWQPRTSDKGYQWWHFDALSDDGSEAVVITFIDNSVFSRGYNGRLNVGRDRYLHLEDDSPTPTVLFSYYRDGKAVHRTIEEFSAESFVPHPTLPGCSIGPSSFVYDSAAYGTGFTVVVNAELSKGRHLEAHFEWLSVESDLSAGKFLRPRDTFFWNMVAPRSDVTGRITVTSREGAETEVRHFRGTGYHDHSADDRWLADTVSERHWGRAHFADATAVFQQYRETGQEEAVSELYVISGGELTHHDVRYEAEHFVRDKFGIKYPAAFTLRGENGVAFSSRAVKVLDSTFFFLRFLSEMSLDTGDGRARGTIGITEILAPKTLKYRWLEWVMNLRARRNLTGKPEAPRSSTPPSK